MTNLRFVLALLLLAFNCAMAQTPKNSLLYNYVTEKRANIKTTESFAVFQKATTIPSTAITKVLASQQFLFLDKNKSRSLFKQKPFSISLAVPYKDKTYQLELVQENISMNGTPAGTITGNGTRKKIGNIRSVHYRGYIKNDPLSIASFSVFENGEIMGLFCNSSGNFNVGKTGGGNYILYNSSNMISTPGFECSTDALPAVGEYTSKQVAEPLAVPQVLCNKVRIYWEADYKLYNFNFANNYTNTVNYLSGLFNQVATMYHNEGIIVELSELYVWSTPDTFTTTSSGTGLTAIKNRWNALGNSFNGDLCMLIDGGPTNNGGRAYLLNNNICNRSFAYGYSNIYGHYNTLPSYSWDVEVITHETGHNLGSHHTHWCGWNTGAGGTCGAIDDCYTLETTAACSSCSATTITNPTPPAGFTGTVMSYCHLRSGIGINLANGFGTLPKALIRENVTNSSCTIQENKWTGTISTAWETPGNWSCGSIPTAATDVTISNTVGNFPVISSAAICRKLRQTTGASVTVNQGFSLNVVGTD